MRKLLLLVILFQLGCNGVYVPVTATLDTGTEIVVDVGEYGYKVGDTILVTPGESGRYLFIRVPLPKRDTVLEGPLVVRPAIITRVPVRSEPDGEEQTN